MGPQHSMRLYERVGEAVQLMIRASHSDTLIRVTFHQTGLNTTNRLFPSLAIKPWKKWAAPNPPNRTTAC